MLALVLVLFRFWCLDPSGWTEGHENAWEKQDEGGVSIVALLADEPEQGMLLHCPMNEFRSSDDHAPVTYLNGYPLYAAHFIVLVFVVSMLLTTLLPYLGAGAVLNWLPYHSGLVLSGQVWRLLTYGLVNHPDIWFVIDMFMIASFGREVEKTFGRAKFFQLYAGLYLLTPLLLTLITALHIREQAALAGETGAFALFIAFATLYPGAIMLFNVLAKWVAVILVAIYALMAIDAHDGVALISLFATVGFAHGFVRYQQGRFSLPTIRLPKRQPKLRVVPDLKESEVPAGRGARGTAPTASMVEIDALLDKIAHSGMASLTPKERAQLEKAREELKKRGPGRP